VGFIAHQYFEGSATYVDGVSIAGGVSTFAATTGIRRSLGQGDLPARAWLALPARGR